MALEAVKLKRGMGGSKGGKGRTAKTSVYKQQSKKQRRRDAKREINEN